MNSTRNRSGTSAPDPRSGTQGATFTPAGVELVKPSRLARIFKAVYHDLITDQKHEVTFWVLLAFLPTWILTRAFVYFMPQLFINVGGTHIHHLTWGIILLAISGWLALLIEEPKWRPRIATLYGIGLALAFDEFGMWLHLRDEYWIRNSYDAILTILAILINVVYFGDFWLRLVRRITHTHPRPLPPPMPPEEPSI